MGTPIVQIYMTTNEKFEKWERDDLYFIKRWSNDDIEFLTKQQAIQRIEEDSKKYGDGGTFDQLLKEWIEEDNGSEESFFRENDFYSYECFFNRNGGDFAFTQNVSCECGISYVIFGYTGW